MPTVLVIDDTLSSIDMVRTSVPDWTVLCAFDGIAGLEMLTQHHETIDLVLLDLQMPRMDGRQALPQIRALYPRIPVRLWSASVDSADRRLALELTGRPLVKKPISTSALAAEMYQTLGQEAPPPRQGGEMREQAPSKPAILIVCESDRERTALLTARLQSAELKAGLIQSPLHLVRLFTEQDDLCVLVVFHNDFQGVLLLNAPIICVCGDIATAIQARDQLEEFMRASGQQIAVAIIVDEPEHPDDVLSRMQFALQELLAGRSVLPERV